MGSAPIETNGFFGGLARLGNRLVSADPNAENDRALRRVLRFLRGAVLVGLAAEAIVALFWTSFPGAVRLLGGLLLVSCAAASVGALAGFLFGIPRVAAGDAASGAAQSSPTAKPNTNLEEISDWLTKIIVGLGLAHLYKLGPVLLQLASKMAPLLVPIPTDAGIAAVLATLAYWSTTGFLGGYSLTRMFLAPAFARADKQLDLAKQAAELAEVPLDLPTDATQRPTAALPSALAAQVNEIASQPLEAFETPQGIRGWAKAQTLQGRPEEAERALSLLAAGGTQDASIWYELGVALSRENKRSEAITALNRALSLAHADATTTRARIVEGLMLNLLYVPGGYARVITLASQHRSDTVLSNSGKFWMYFACALGQSFGFMQGKGASEEQLNHVRENALDVVRKAIALDPSLVPLVRTLVSGRDPMNDDLAVFKDHPDFQSL